ncbi:MAG: BamA/TamA family outer membrane protein, partial [Archangium sp.]|nr:BamA/TamA family outer membrane protein [Archangium sp.]
RVQSLIGVRKGQALSRRAISRSIEALFATGKFADIEVFTEETATGVDVIFSVVPRQNLGGFFVEGARGVTREDVLASTKLELGAEYWPERLEQAAENVRALYHRRGYRKAKVRTEAVLLEGTITAGFIIEEGEPVLLRSVVLSGEPGLPLVDVINTFGLKPGAVLDLNQIDNGLERVRALFRTQRFYRARIDLPEVTDDGQVVLPVVSGPKYDLVFSGNRALSDSGLRAVIAYDGGETLDASLAERLAARIERFYRFRGYFDVKVTASEVRRGGGNAALGFSIQEGLPVRVTRVDFDGAKAISRDELRLTLRRVMETFGPPQPFDVHSNGDPTDVHGRQSAVFAQSVPNPAGDTVFEESGWIEAAKAMTVQYREKGYLRASVTFAGAEVHGQTAEGRFTITEGPRAAFRFVQARGLPAGFASDAMGTVTLGTPFSPGELSRLEQGVTRELGRKGYLFADVTASYELDETGEQADALLTVNSGPQVKVRAVVPSGQRRTVESIITGQATMKEGLPLDSESLFSTQANLNSLGIFRNVQVEMLAPDRPEPLKTVILKVKEKPLFAAEGFLGYFYADGIRGGVEGSISNIGGRGITLTGRAQANLFFTSGLVLADLIDLGDTTVFERIGFRGNASLDLKSIMPTGFGLRLDFVGERVFRTQFRFSRVAGVPTLDWTHVFDSARIDWLRPKLTLALQYELEWTSVARTGGALSAIPPTSLVDQERLRFLFGVFTLHSGRMNATLDLRDSPLTPRRGLLLQASGELTGAISAIDEAEKPVTVNFTKVSGLATGYIPIGERVVVAVSVRAGRIFPLQAGSTTPPVRRFFLGGATSVRGFNEDQLIAQDDRERYRQQVRDCNVLATKAGCSSAANTVLAGRQVPSQGGELFAVGKLEVRFPAFSVFDFGVFAEAGNLWLAAPDTFALRPVVGAGLRYVTPIGPLALDVGYNLTADSLINEPPVVVHFNIGVF